MKAISNNINWIYFLLLLNMLSCSSDDDPKKSKDIFRDDFNSDTIDESVWQIATWPEHGGQTGKSRCYAKDGYLNMLFI